MRVRVEIELEIPGLDCITNSAPIFDALSDTNRGEWLSVSMVDVVRENDRLQSSARFVASLPAPKDGETDAERT